MVTKRPGFKRKLSAAVIGTYLLLLAASHVTRARNAADRPLPPGKESRWVLEVDGDRLLDQKIRMAYTELAPAATPADGVVVLLHGSPPYSKTFRKIGPLLARRYRVLIPDLPGFRDSRRSIQDYSVRAHAHYVRQWLDLLQIDAAHIVGYSMSGGVALNLADIAPQQVASITLLSAIGVQEMEFTGDFHLNRVFHGLQLGLIWFVQEAIPHFGLFDGMVLDVPYARNFFDTDQRPLRGILESYDRPLLIVHSRGDMLVPVEAALEHHRVVPHSELAMFEGDHFIIMREASRIADIVGNFVRRAERDAPALSRASAAPERLAAAGRPFDPMDVVPLQGIQLWVVLVVIFFGTFVTEDLMCITAGLLIARGALEPVPGILACFAGIYFGDMLLYALGRFAGRPLVRRRPFSLVLHREQLRQAERWFAERGVYAIFASRFIPGTRLATYITAGIMKTPYLSFAGYFFLAVCVWVPVLVGGTILVGRQMFEYVSVYKEYALPGILLVVLGILFFSKVVVRLFTFRGRRRLVGSLKRLVCWEFWSPWVFYVPVFFHYLWLCLKYRGLTHFTAVNPGIIGGGFIGESKYDILHNLDAFGTDVARSRLIKGDQGAANKEEAVMAFLAEFDGYFPVVVKPDIGQRGSGVHIVRSPAQLTAFCRDNREDFIVQEYISGEEFGVLYYRYPDADRGRIFSVTVKKLPFVTGDGTSTLEALILRDPRAVCMAKTYCRRHAARLADVPARGERVQLVDIGTHCRGAVFLDGQELITPELEEAIERISRRFRDFYFGRYDIRARSAADLRRGKHFTVIELNGATSEATHIYDPKHGVLYAYRVLFRQWAIIFEIAARNKARGCSTNSLGELVRMLMHYRRTARSRVPASG